MHALFLNHQVALFVSSSPFFFSKLGFCCQDFEEQIRLKFAFFGSPTSHIVVSTLWLARLGCYIQVGNSWLALLWLTYGRLFKVGTSWLSYPGCPILVGLAWLPHFGRLLHYFYFYFYFSTMMEKK